MRCVSSGSYTHCQHHMESHYFLTWNDLCCNQPLNWHDGVAPSSILKTISVIHACTGSCRVIPGPILYMNWKEKLLVFQDWYTSLTLFSLTMFSACTANGTLYTFAVNLSCSLVLNRAHTIIIYFYTVYRLYNYCTTCYSGIYDTGPLLLNRMIQLIDISIRIRIETTQICKHADT